MTNDGQVTAGEVITAESVREEAEFYVEDNKVFREAFRQIDNTDIASDTVQIPVQQDTTGEVGTVGEASSYPREDEQMGKVSISHDKYGREVAMTYESIEDGLLDVVANHAQEQARDLARGLDSAASEEVLSFDAGNSVYNNLQDAPVGDDSGALDYNTVVDAMTALEVEGYEPDMLIVGPESKGDLLKSDDFTRASEMGDEVIMSGSFGQIAGIDVMVSNRGILGAGEAVMIDSEQYGYESVRSQIDTMEYEEEETDERVIKIRTRMGWGVTRPKAGVKVEA